MRLFLARLLIGKGRMTSLKDLYEEMNSGGEHTSWMPGYWRRALGRLVGEE